MSEARDDAEDRIRASSLWSGHVDDLDVLKSALDEGYNISRSDAYALIREIEVLRGRLEEARSTRNLLIRKLGGAA